MYQDTSSMHLPQFVLFIYNVMQTFSLSTTKVGDQNDMIYLVASGEIEMLVWMNDFRKGIHYLHVLVH